MKSDLLLRLNDCLEVNDLKKIKEGMKSTIQQNFSFNGQKPLKFGKK